MSSVPSSRVFTRLQSWRLQSLRRMLAWAFALFVLFGALAALATWWLLFSDLPPVSALQERLVRPTTQILDRNGRLLYEVMDQQTGKQHDLSLASMPAACVQATLATEDKRFYSHPGVDVIAIARATWQNLRARGDIVSGASTITQQVARNTLLGADERYTQSFQRKLREAWLALQIEQAYSKDEILALYLNQTYYGHFAFGVEAAANIFFAKPAAQLSRGECALIAGLAQYPTGYNPLAVPEVAKARQLTVLRLMEDAGFIDGTQSAQIAAEPMRYKSSLFAIEAPHFVMYVQELLAQRLGVDRLRAGGLRVVTSLDLDLQHEAEQAVRYRLDLLNCRLPGLCTSATNPERQVDNAAAIVLDSHSGDILAMVGSPNYFDASIQGNLNAALAMRQPGSAIKPLTYAAALDPAWSSSAGVPPLTPASILADLPTTFYVTDQTGASVPYAPVNYNRKTHGPVSVREALANSYNIPAVKVLDRLGVETLKRLGSEAGITSFTRDFGLALTLGGGEVRLLELTTAFGALDDGVRLDPRAILSINDAAPSRTTAAPRVISEQAAWLLTDILSDETARLPAFGSGSVLELPFPAAVKTGTTTDWRDNWTLGYSTQRVVGVWVGNADNTPMEDVSGVDGAGPIWNDIMRAAHAAAPPPFARPAGIVDATVCVPSGMLATDACPRTRLEHFISGTEPTQPDNQFHTLLVDRATGLPIADVTSANVGNGNPAAATRPANAITRTFWDLPIEYQEWARAEGIALLPPAALLAGTTGAQMNATNQPLALAQGNAPADDPLILSEPASNIVYRLYPGMPASSQRIAVRGFVQDGAAWASLRLVAAGAHGEEVLASTSATNRLEGWFTLQPGTYQIRIEGEPTIDEPSVRSRAATVVVEAFSGESEQ